MIVSDEIIKAATEKMRAIAKRCEDETDPIALHVEADELLTQFLKDIGAVELAEIYEEASKDFYYS